MPLNAQNNLDAMRRPLLEAARAEAAFGGWTGETLKSAEREAGLEAGTAALAFPEGVVDMLDFWGAECDRAARAAIADADLSAMKIRERVAFAARARIEAIGDDHREAARRAAARLLLPDAAMRGSHILWRAADTIWRAIGDPSTDGNFYSKRAILSGVLANTLAAWLNADGPDDEAPWTVLDRRIANVMEFEKFKGQVRKVTDQLPSPVALATSLRYGRRG